MSHNFRKWNYDPIENYVSGNPNALMYQRFPGLQLWRIWAGEQGTPKKRMSSLLEVGLRSWCGPRHVVDVMRGTHPEGWDVEHLLARYLKYYGKPLKRETLYRLYYASRHRGRARLAARRNQGDAPSLRTRVKQARDAAREPAQISPSLQASLDRLGTELIKHMI